MNYIDDDSVCQWGSADPGEPRLPKQAVGIDLLLWLTPFKRLENHEEINAIPVTTLRGEASSETIWRLAHGVEAFPIRLPACQSKLPQDPDDLPDDLEALLAPADLEGGHAGVFRLEDDHVLLEEDALDGGLVVHQGHHDLSVLRRGLVADQREATTARIGASLRITRGWRRTRVTSSERAPRRPPSSCAYAARPYFGCPSCWSMN